MTDLEKRVLEKIERLALRPRPPGYFLARRSMFWSLAITAILFGGICASVAIFIVADFFRTGGRGFDEMPFDELAIGLPFIWFFLLALFVASAFFTISKTGRAYRFGPFRLAGLAAGLSLGLGVLFYVSDIGKNIHAFLSAHIPAYQQMTHIPYAEWQRPDEGYLGGEALSVDDEMQMQLRGFDGKRWTVDISKADLLLDKSPVEEGDVAMHGHRTGPASFMATSIAPFD